MGMSRKSEMGCFAIFLGVFSLVGFVTLGYGVWSAWRSTQAANWPTAQGILTSVTLNEQSDDGSAYEVQVEYTYTVAGNVYRGSRLAFGYMASSGKQIHTEILKKLQAAKSVDVRYDPDNPASSVLSYGIHRSIQLTIGFAVFWLAFTLGFTLVWILFSRNDNVLLENLSMQ